MNKSFITNLTMTILWLQLMLSFRLVNALAMSHGLNPGHATSQNCSFGILLEQSTLVLLHVTPLEMHTCLTC